MAFPTQILQDINRGNIFLSDRNLEHITDLRTGCTNCTFDGECLAQIMRALGYKVELDEYDQVAIGLYDQMMLIIGNYTITVGPQVNAGQDKIVNISDTTNFTATITQGAAIITNILWTQVYGPNTATLFNANAAVMTASGFQVGDYVFRVTVTDANNLTASDTVYLAALSSVGSGTILTSAKYSSANRTSDTTIIIPELIGCDLSFFIAHRGVGTTLTGNANAADDQSVKVDNVTWYCHFLLSI